MKAEWKKNTDPDAEHNSYVATLNGHELEVFSDIGETEWCYVVDGETSFGCRSRTEAQLDAEKDANQ